jgi:hypothetical protein
MGGMIDDVVDELLVIGDHGREDGATEEDAIDERL